MGIGGAVFGGIYKDKASTAEMKEALIAALKSGETKPLIVYSFGFGLPSNGFFNREVSINRSGRREGQFWVENVLGMNLNVT